MKLQQPGQKHPASFKPLRSGPPDPKPPLHQQDKFIPEPVVLMTYVREGAAAGKKAGTKMGAGAGSIFLSMPGMMLGVVGVALVGSLLSHSGATLAPMTYGSIDATLADLGTAGKPLALLGRRGVVGGIVGKALGSVYGLAKGLTDRMTGGRPEPKQLDLDYSAPIKEKELTTAQMSGILTGAMIGGPGGAALPVLLGATSLTQTVIAATAVTALAGAVIVATGGAKLAGAAETLADKLRSFRWDAA
jgi:hypothetical protein